MAGDCKNRRNIFRVERKSGVGGGVEVGTIGSTGPCARGLSTGEGGRKGGDQEAMPRRGRKQMFLGEEKRVRKKKSRLFVVQRDSPCALAGREGPRYQRKARYTKGNEEEKVGAITPPAPGEVVFGMGKSDADFVTRHVCAFFFCFYLFFFLFSLTSQY